MTVIVRNKRSDKGIRRRRTPSGLFTGTRGAKSASAGEAAANTEAAQRPADTAATAPPVRTVDDSAPGRRRLHGPVQDNAVYSCRCGFVFEAQVSTSVGCPHCGDSQAW